MKYLITILSFFITLFSAAQDGGYYLLFPQPATTTTFDPATLTSGTLVGWYKSDIGTTLVSSGVDVWVNQVSLSQPGRMGDFSAPASSARPTLETNSAGYTSLRFDGTVSQMQNTTGIFSGGRFTVVCVIEPLTTGAGMLLNGSAGWTWQYNNSSSMIINNISPYTVTNSFSVLTLNSSTNVTAYQNLASVQTQGPNLVDPTHLRLGAYNGTIGDPGPGVAGFLNARICELLFYAEPLSDADRTLLYNNYLKPKYNLP